MWSLLTHMTTRWLGFFTDDPQLYEDNINKLYYFQDNNLFICVPLSRNYLISNQRTTISIASLYCEINFNIDEPTTQPICIFVMVIL